MTHVQEVVNLNPSTGYWMDILTLIVVTMDHRVFQFATRGQCIKGKKLDCFEHNYVFCFKLQCASIVVLLSTAIWWKSKDAVVHCMLCLKRLKKN